jgi:hypothetical protein
MRSADPRRPADQESAANDVRRPRSAGWRVIPATARFPHGDESRPHLQWDEPAWSAFSGRMR